MCPVLVDKRQRPRAATFDSVIHLAPTPTALGRRYLGLDKSPFSNPQITRTANTLAVGVTSTGGMVEVLTTGDGTTRTIIVSNPNGISCLIAVGEGWRALRLNNAAADPGV